MEPIDTTQPVAEPTGEERALYFVSVCSNEWGTGLTYYQSIQITEYRNSLGNDPCDNPASDTETNPDPDGAFAAAVDKIRLVAETEIYVLEADVTINHTSSNNLKAVSCTLWSQWKDGRDAP
jgi:hypothetical protein